MLLWRERFLPAQRVSRILGLDNTKHKDTPISLIEQHLAILLGSIRGFLTIEHVRNSFDYVESDGVLVCAQCKKGAQQLAQENLLRCAQCKTAYYCSKECQVEHWKSSHKRRCSILANLHP